MYQILELVFPFDLMPMWVDDRFGWVVHGYSKFCISKLIMEKLKEIFRYFWIEIDMFSKKWFYFQVSSIPILNWFLRTRMKLDFLLSRFWSNVFIYLLTLFNASLEIDWFFFYFTMCYKWVQVHIHMMMCGSDVEWWH